MSTENTENNAGAGTVVLQPGVFGNNGGTGDPAPGSTVQPGGMGGSAPNAPLLNGGDSVPETGSPATEPVNEPAVLPDLTEYATSLFVGVEPESLDYKLFERARLAAHKAGIPAEALGAVMGDVRTFITETEAQIVEARLDASMVQLKELRQTYGNRFDAVMEACNNTLANLATEFGVDVSVFNLPEIRNNPDVVKFFYGLSQSMKEAGFARVDKMAEVATAEQELDSLYCGSHALSKAFMDSSHPDWGKAQDRVNYLTNLTIGK